MTEIKKLYENIANKTKCQEYVEVRILKILQLIFNFYNF